MPKKTYQEMLKENLSEFDTTKTVDVKGPMLDPILGYEGDGELPTYKDAASVLERYYFGEKKKEDEISEMDYENDKGDSSGESMKNTEGPEGEQQAGTSKADTPQGSEKEKEKDIAKESKEGGKDGEVVSEKEMNTPDLKSKEMKDADGPEGEEQAGTGDTYKEFKKRVVEAIEDIVEQTDHDEDKETPEDEKDESDETQDKEKEEGKEKHMKEMDEKDEKCEKCGKEKCECPAADKDKKEEEMKEDAGVGAGPLPALAAKAKNDNKEGDEADDYDDTKGKGKGKDKDVKENDEIELTPDTEDITESLENEIIEKLISEMEDEAETVTEQDEEVVADADAEAEVKEEDEEDEGLDVDKKMEEMVNRLTQGHTEGPEGEEQAGTGGEEKVIPPRKDRSDEGDKTKGVKPMDKGELADA
jgi:hypothetical protein